tara:strand:+ start:180 stop:293 length:114 start_codon:yes stop_codon:yes gene_type:complete
MQVDRIIDMLMKDWLIESVKDDLDLNMYDKWIEEDER